MNQMIKQLIKIETNAQEILQEAEQAGMKISAGIDDECSKIQKDILTRQEERLRKFEENEKLTAEERETCIRKSSEVGREALKAMFEEKKEQWVCEIYQNIIDLTFDR